MKKTKKMLALLAGTAMLISSLAGCSQSPSAPQGGRREYETGRGRTGLRKEGGIRCKREDSCIYILHRLRSVGSCVGGSDRRIHAGESRN